LSSAQRAAIAAILRPWRERAPHCHRDEPCRTGPNCRCVDATMTP
jgi:hypothetical protein